jgi:hypothetical protein
MKMNDQNRLANSMGLLDGQHAISIYARTNCVKEGGI